MSTEESENNVNHAHWAKSIKDGTAIIAFNEQTKNMQIRHRRELQNFNDTGLPRIGVILLLFQRHHARH